MLKGLLIFFSIALVLLGNNEAYPKEKQFSGIYSNVEYFEGDLSGFEMEIRYRNSKYEGTIQYFFGAPGPLMKINPFINKNHISIEISGPPPTEDPGKYKGKFEGEISQETIKGTLDDNFLCSKCNMTLKRINKVN